VETSAAPILDRDGEVLGAVLVVKDTTDSRRWLQRVAYEASHDSLTGLVNRREFENRLERILRNCKEQGASAVLCYLDLDQFKIVNDSVGHTAGDEMLRQVATELKTYVRSRDTLARLGGDEFSLLLENCSIEKAAAVARMLIDAVRAFQFAYAGRSFGIGVSIGLVPITPDTEDRGQLLTRADLACYAAKDMGGNRVCTYRDEDPELNRRHREILRVAELREALEENRFRLFAQPIRSLTDIRGEPLHYELLLRLVDRDGEVLSPGDFIPAAERFGLMGILDRWVIEEALTRYSLLVGSGRVTGIAINLSGNSLSDEGLLDFVRRTLQASGIPPERICFEITETTAINRLSEVDRFITELRRIGCRFALDDFGSGLSSFTYLKKLRVDFLKIDGAFVRDMTRDRLDRAMVSAINEIGHIMGMRTIAEWAETEAVVEHLRASGVDFVQGHALGPPLPIEEVFRTRTGEGLVSSDRPGAKENPSFPGPAGSER
jgi:diguanylate cyclase (GGDEF)-like protein